MKLSNGLEILYYPNNKVPKIELLELKAKSYYDPEQLLGLNTLISAMLLEGTKNYTAQELAQEIESYGMTLSTSPGYISLTMLTSDCEKGLSLLADILMNSTFDEKAVEKIRDILLSDIRDFWDNPAEFSSDLVRQQFTRKIIHLVKIN